MFDTFTFHCAVTHGESSLAKVLQISCSCLMTNISLFCVAGSDIVVGLEMSRSRDKTGGNTEPMPFVRKFGAAAVAAAAAGEPLTEAVSEENAADAGTSFFLSKRY